jgi:hypothetical protein
MAGRRDVAKIRFVGEEAGGHNASG